MTRNRASAKAAGSRFERVIADHLADHIDERIDRRVKTGNKDRGDIAGFRHAGMKIVVEIKDVARTALGPWVEEAELERRNDDAGVGVVIHKRRGRGNPADQFVTMTVNDFIVLLGGDREAM